MIENTLWMTYFEYLPIELKQAEEEGKNVELYRKEIEEIIQTSGDMSFEEKERKAWEILDRIEKEPIKREFPYQEPNEIEKIEELRNTELYCRSSDNRRQSLGCMAWTLYWMFAGPTY